MPPIPQTTAEAFPAGSYGYGLNLALPATTNGVAINSKRVERRFRLTSVNSAFLFSVGSFSLILGTEQQQWFSGFVRAETILGDAAFPHFLPANGVIIEKGDYIVCTARNDNSTAKRVALIFQGEHI